MATFKIGKQKIRVQSEGQCTFCGTKDSPGYVQIDSLKLWANPKTNPKFIKGRSRSVEVPIYACLDCNPKKKKK